MSIENKNKKKYPKSINNLQCLGPCYNKNTSILHPTQLRTYTSKDSFCPTSVHIEKDPNTGASIKMYTDKCLYPTNNEDELGLSSLLTPKSEFTKELFLNLYYGINSFTQCIEWISNNMYVSLKTQIRVVNAALNVFGNDIDLIDDRFTSFYIEYIKKKEISKIYDKIHKKIGIIDNDVLIVDEENNSLNKEDKQTERTNYMIKKFVNNDSIKGFLLKYVYAHKKWEDVNDNLDLMTHSFIAYTENRLRRMI
jgi:hypothetical protein